jgi:glutamate-1-semialdehyde 2,1-aminomutase
MKIEKSKELYSKALTLMPGGVSSPVRAFKSVGGTPLFMKKGSGPILTDEDGNEFIDYCMSWGPLILGHADPDVLAAIVEAAHNGTSFGTPNRFEVELAELVTARMPSMEKVRFVSSGTEAVMSALRLARGFTGRDRIVKCDGCYHGHADHMLVAGGSGLATFGTPDSAGVTQGNARDTIVVPFNDLDRLEDVFKKERGQIAAFILEPVPCNYGLIPPFENIMYYYSTSCPDSADPGINACFKSDGYLAAVRRLCDAYGVLLIFDEVITGFRLAPGGAQEFFGVRADITTFGKIIGGGLPVGAYGASREIMAKVAPDGPVYQAGTLSGNPLAMSAGIATLKKLDAIGAYTHLDNSAMEFRTLLAPALRKHEGRVLFLQLGSIFAFYFTAGNAVLSLDDVKACDMKLFARFHGEMLGRGVYLSPSGYEVGFLSTAHSAAELGKTARAVADSLDAVL